MKTPQENFIEEMAEILGTIGHEEWLWNVKQKVKKHFPPPSEDGIEEIAERFTAWRHAHMDTKEAIKQAILADRQAWETAARADCYLH